MCYTSLIFFKCGHLCMWLLDCAVVEGYINSVVFPVNEKSSKPHVALGKKTKKKTHLSIPNPFYCEIKVGNSSCIETI